jgi:hypothetical protein
MLFGLFSKNKFISYLINLEPTKISIRRNYQDFEWLRLILTKLYPNIYVRILFI